MLTIITMLYIRFSDLLIYFLAESFYPFIILSLFSPILLATSFLLCFYEFHVFIFLIPHLLIYFGLTREYMNLLHVPALADSDSNIRSQFLLCQLSSTVLILGMGESKWLLSNISLSSGALEQSRNHFSEPRYDSTQEGF